jgi:hypothetical protein
MALKRLAQREQIWHPAVEGSEEAALADHTSPTSRRSHLGGDEGTIGRVLNIVDIMIREKGVSAGKGATDAPDPRGMSRRDTMYSKYGMYGVVYASRLLRPVMLHLQ